MNKDGEEILAKVEEEPAPEQSEQGDKQNGEAGDKVIGFDEIVQEVFTYAPHEEKPVYPERRLQRSEISTNLCMLGKTADGHGYTYLKVKLIGLGLTELGAITGFQHLQHVDVSKNFLTLDALQTVAELPFLIYIQADNNILDSAALKQMKYLQVIVMNKNFINALEDFYQPELSTLELGENQISRISFKEKMTHLRCLDLRYNKIENIKEIDFINLDSLYLAGNRIISLEGIERLVNLRILHVRNNPIRQLNVFTGDLSKLNYINLRYCKVATILQVKKLRVLTALRTLILRGCPLMGGRGEEVKEVLEEEDDDTDVRATVLASLPRLTRLNKNVVTPEERDEANELMKTWFEEGENDEEEISEEMQGETDVTEY